jgi:ADP-heptose:LPS heptosyltransferase
VIFDLTPGFSRTNLFISYFAGLRSLRVGVEKEYIADRYHIHLGAGRGHLAERLLDAGEALTGANFSRPRRFEMYSSTRDKDAADQFLKPCRGPIIAVNLSAGNTQRQWSFDRFDGLIVHLAARMPDAMIVLIAIGEQRQWAETLAARYSSCCAAPPFPFLTVTELIGRCALLISADTALIHAASARGVPVVGLYSANAENLVRWGPYGVPSKIIQSSSVNDIGDIEPHAVVDGVVRLMEETGAGRGGAPITTKDSSVP